MRSQELNPGDIADQRFAEGMNAGGYYNEHFVLHDAHRGRIEDGEVVGSGTFTPIASSHPKDDGLWAQTVGTIAFRQQNAKDLVVQAQQTAELSTEQVRVYGDPELESRGVDFLNILPDTTRLAKVQREVNAQAAIEGRDAERRARPLNILREMLAEPDWTAKGRYTRLLFRVGKAAVTGSTRF